MMRVLWLSVVSAVLGGVGCATRSAPEPAPHRSTPVPLPPEIRIGASIDDIEDWAWATNDSSKGAGGLWRCRASSLPTFECGEWVLVFSLEESSRLLAVLRKTGGQSLTYELPQERRGEATTIGAVWMADETSRAALKPSSAPPIPAPFDVLGRPCNPRPPVTEIADGREWSVCSRDGWVAGLFVRRTRLGWPPPSAIRVIEEPASGSYVALDGEWLWISWMTCARCRGVQGWSFVGDVGALGDEALLRLQQELGLDASVQPLRTAKAWREARLPMPPTAPAE